MAEQCSCCVICLACIASLSIPLIIAGHVVESFVKPTGELPVWYEVGACPNGSDNVLSVSGFGGEADTGLEPFNRSFVVN